KSAGRFRLDTDLKSSKKKYSFELNRSGVKETTLHHDHWNISENELSNLDSVKRFPEESLPESTLSYKTAEKFHNSEEATTRPLPVELAAVALKEFGAESREIDRYVSNGLLLIDNGEYRLAKK